jgi:2-beta-glucuronyltransferase
VPGETTRPSRREPHVPSVTDVTGPHGKPNKRIVFLSAYHDYRTAKRASIQHIADGLVRAGYDVTFISTRFSLLSHLTKDSRLLHRDMANRIEIVNGVRCYLWWTAAHPFKSRYEWVNAFMSQLYPLYAESPDATFDRLVSAADYIIVESGVAAIYIRRLRRLNANAEIIYYGSDRLDTVGAHPYVRQRLEADATLVHHCSVRSSRMVSDLRWAEGRIYRAEFGVESREMNDVGPNPYLASAKTAVSVGSMLFDPSFFQLAAPNCPDIEFLVIGCGTDFKAPANVRVLPEMRFADTLPYLKYATIGIAPYRSALGSEYLAESSLKLAQYESFALPAVCPVFAVGDVASRFGYFPGDEASIRTALASALAFTGRVKGRKFLSWEEVALRVLEPQLYPDTKLDDVHTSS